MHTTSTTKKVSVFSKFWFGLRSVILGLGSEGQKSVKWLRKILYKHASPSWPHFRVFRLIRAQHKIFTVHRRIQKTQFSSIS
jgi:hypothetical protein